MSQPSPEIPNGYWIQQMFQRWDTTRQQDAETMDLVAADIRSECRDIRAKIATLGENNDLFTIKPPADIDFSMREASSLIPKAQVKPTDWSITMSLTSLIIIPSTIRMLRWKNVDGKSEQERKWYSFSISDVATGPITWYVHDLKRIDMETQDYRDLHRITSVLRRALTSQK